MLAQIERSIRHVGSEHERADYRRSLLDAAATWATTCAAIARYAARIVPRRRPTPVKSARFSASHEGLRTATITACEHSIAAFEAALRTTVDNDHPAAPQMAEAFERLIDSGDAIPAAAPRPLILIPAPALSRIHDGGGDDVVLGLTDGTTITGTDLVNNYLSDPKYGLEAAIFHPTEGPVNHYRGSRFASEKQRALVKAVQPICASPDCRIPADHCEVHHTTAWKNGGNTNLNNLAVACTYHNRVNDDDDHIRKRGRIRVHKGNQVWISPTGRPRMNERHPYGAMITLFGWPPLFPWHLAKT